MFGILIADSEEKEKKWNNWKTVRESACEVIPEPQHLITHETDKRNKESEISSARNIEETLLLENPQSLDILKNPEPSDVLENPQPGPFGMHLQSVHVQDDEHNEQSDMSLLTVLESNTDLSNVASADPIQEESQADQQATSKGGKKSTGKGKGRGKGKGKGKKDEEKTENDACGICNKKYKSSEDWICCDECLVWYHRGCVGLEDESLWEEVSTEEKRYLCPMCH